MDDQPVFLQSPSGFSRPAVAVTQEMRQQVADRLLAGEAPDQLIRWLEVKGVVPSAARREIEGACRDPFFTGSKRLLERLAKRDWQLSIYRRLGEIDPAAGTLAIEDGISADDFLRRYYAANRPVLLRGMIDGWPAMAKWSLDYFESLFGDASVSVQIGRERSPDYERHKDRHTAKMPFSELAAKFRSEEPTNDFYITAGNEENPQLLAPLWEDVGALPGILDFSGGNRGFFWMGPKGTITPFHHDLTNNLLVQIRGRKRVKLIAAHDAALMRNDTHCYSEWGGEDLPEGAPGGDRPRVMEITLDEGEILFLPVGWWHHVEGLERTIGMSFTNFAWPNDHYRDYSSFGRM